MIQSYDDYLFYLEADRISLNQKRKKPKLIGDLKNDIWKFQRLLRKLEYIRNCKRGLAFKIVYYILRYKFQHLSYKLNFEIPLNVCGPGLCLVHSGTIIINGNAKIGKNCRIHSGVNIGSIDSMPQKAPKLGDNIYIGPGVKIYGDIILSNDIVIGANSVVNKSFSIGNFTIAGSPSKKINDNGSSNMIIKGTELVKYNIK